MNMVNNMTAWIQNDAQITQAYHQTERPETTTKGEMIVADPDGTKFKLYDLLLKLSF